MFSTNNRPACCQSLYNSRLCRDVTPIAKCHAAQLAVCLRCAMTTARRFPQTFLGRPKRYSPADISSSHTATVILRYATHWTAGYCCNASVLKPSSVFACRPKPILWVQQTPSFTHSWCWALLEKLPIVQILKNFPAFYGTRRFIVVFTRALHWDTFIIIIIIIIIIIALHPFVGLWPLFQFPNPIHSR
jgi:hypothetical protein